MKFPPKYIDMAETMIEEMNAMQYTCDDGLERLKATLEMLKGYTSTELSHASTALLYSYIIARADDAPIHADVNYTYMLLMSAMIEVLRQRAVI